MKKFIVLTVLLLPLSLTAQWGYQLGFGSVLGSDETQPKAKRSLLVKKVRFIKREELKEKDLETNNEWEDQAQKSPELVKRVSKIDLNAGDIR